MPDLNLIGFKKIECESKSQDVCFIYDNLGRNVIFISSEIYVNESPLCEKWKQFQQVGEESKFGSIYPVKCDGNLKSYALKKIPFIEVKNKNSPIMTIEDIVAEINLQNHIFHILPGFTTSIYWLYELLD